MRENGKDGKDGMKPERERTKTERRETGQKTVQGARGGHMIRDKPIKIAKHC